MEIWINPRCSKCRTAIEFLDEAGAEYTVRRYLEEPPTAEELREVLERLGLEPWDITRTGEAVAKELGISGWGKTGADRERWIEALAGHPTLIQRPIITADDGHAVVGRSDEALRSVVEPR
ncbi:arsenate reductase family protein [Actinospica robiniae]|uniref:arsenate reductase family protein n=1 Tax=Actinospica robiniae TaxID=304901 RepID=UPI0004222825|nr:arsenate reductase family protein [Actinospica robiniae]